MDRITKFLTRIPQKDRLRVLETLDCLAESECRATLQPEKLGGSRFLYRVRIGRYRIIFHINEHNEAIVNEIRPRNERTYRDL